MTTSDALMIAGALALPIAFVLWALIYWQGRRVFATKEDLNGLGERLGRNEAKAERNETLAEEAQRRLDLLEQASTAAQQRLTETVAEPIKEIRKGMIQIQETLTTMRVEHGQKIAQHDRDLSSLGRNMDELKGRVAEVERATKGRGS